MGYWNAGRGGSSLHAESTGLVWGDRPADAMSDALEEVYKAFVEDVGRPPTEAEIRSGLEFSLPYFLSSKGIKREGEEE